jgi:hypothetical protein
MLAHPSEAHVRNLTFLLWLLLLVSCGDRDSFLGKLYTQGAVLAALDPALQSLAKGEAPTPLIPPELWLGLDGWNGDSKAFRKAARGQAKAQDVPRRALKGLVQEG